MTVELSPRCSKLAASDHGTTTAEVLEFFPIFNIAKPLG